MKDKYRKYKVPAKCLKSLQELCIFMIMAMAVYKFIQKKGFAGGYGIVNNFVKKYKKSEQQKAAIRFETTPGLQAQVEWKYKVLMIDEIGYLPVDKQGARP